MKSCTREQAERAKTQQFERYESLFAKKRCAVETYVGTCFREASGYFISNTACTTSDNNGTSVESKLLENTVLDGRIRSPDRSSPVCAVWSHVVD